jgi:hypothetical protein
MFEVVMQILIVIVSVYLHCKKPRRLRKINKRFKNSKPSRLVPTAFRSRIPTALEIHHDDGKVVGRPTRTGVFA